MTSSAELIRRYSGPSLFSFGFRPFFLAGAIVACAAPLVMALSLAGFSIPGFPKSVLLWHAHEMVYGYLAAVIAGFILTAVPNWTGRLPIVGVRLAILFIFWMSGRAAFLFAGDHAIVMAVVDAPFLFVLDFLLWREVLAGKNWRNGPVCFLVFLFACGNAIWHFHNIRGAAGIWGLYFGIAVVAVLLALIGGRVTPSFTRNWFAKTGRPEAAAPFSKFDQVSIGALIFALALWLAAPHHLGAGVALLAAGVLHFIRLLRWRGWATASEPLVLILHIGYFWLALSLALLGLAALAPSAIPATSALHAITAGAMGVMTLAVMTRATRGHTGRPLTADAATIAIFVLVNLGAASRVLAPFWAENYSGALIISSVLWSGAFALFAIVYGAYLLSPRWRGKIVD